MGKMFFCVASRGRYKDLDGNRIEKTLQRLEIRTDSDRFTNTITTVEKDNYIVCNRT